MKRVLLVAGSRSITQKTPVFEQLDTVSESIAMIVSGGALGVDRSAEMWADANGVPKKIFEADWDLHGKSAGHIRNSQMARYVKSQGGSLLLIWDGESKGSLNMRNTATRLEIPFCEIIIPRVRASIKS